MASPQELIVVALRKGDVFCFARHTQAKSEIDWLRCGLQPVMIEAQSNVRKSAGIRLAVLA